jgi:hypothetical protein
MSRSDVAKCTGKGYEFCEDCANQEWEEECDVCEDGDNFDPLDTDQAMHVLRTIIPIKEAA